MKNHKQIKTKNKSKNQLMFQLYLNNNNSHFANNESVIQCSHLPHNFEYINCDLANIKNN